MPLVLCLQLTCEERTEAFQDSCDSDWLCFSYSARRLASLRVSCKDIPGCNLAYVSKSRIFKSSINRVFFGTMRVVTLTFPRITDPFTLLRAIYWGSTTIRGPLIFV
jgi:hypothetical protein